MIIHTESYLILKADIQEALDFVVFVTHAAPALSAYMKAVDSDPSTTPRVPSPEFPGAKSPEPHSRLRALKSSYKKNLGKYLMLSAFSYFEAYIKDVACEVIDFHAIPQTTVTDTTSQSSVDWSMRTRTRLTNMIDSESLDADVVDATRKLRAPFEQHMSQRYERSYQVLSTAGYPLPSSLLTPFAIAKLRSSIDNLRAVDIPELMTAAFLFDLSDEEIREFGNWRTLRNGIAHGQVTQVDLTEALAVGRFFKSLAKRFDQHLVKLFFLQEPR